MTKYFLIGGVMSTNVLLSSEEFLRSKDLHVAQRLFAALIEKHLSVFEGQSDVQILAIASNLEASCLDENGVAAMELINGHHFYAFCTQHTQVENGHNTAEKAIPFMMNKLLGHSDGVGICLLRVSHVAGGYLIKDCEEYLKAKSK